MKTRRGLLGAMGLLALSPSARAEKPDTFSPSLRAQAKAEFGVLIHVEIDGRHAVDEHLGKRHLDMSFVETGHMRRAKELRELIKKWYYEAELVERLRQEAERLK